MDNKTNNHIITLDDEGTKQECYHNMYSYSKVSSLLDQNVKVESFSFEKLLVGTTKSFLTINIVND